MTTAFLSPRSTTAQQTSYRLQLTPRTSTPSAWGERMESNESAHVTLSRDFSCTLVDDAGVPLTTGEIGRADLSLSKAWHHAASKLISKHSFTEGTEFFVRDARVRLPEFLPRGMEVSCKFSPVASWLAHPRTFQLLHRHLNRVLRPVRDLVYFTRDCEELFVFDAYPSEINDCAAQLRGENHAMIYSLGFPLQR